MPGRNPQANIKASISTEIHTIPISLAANAIYFKTAVKGIRVLQSCLGSLFFKRTKENLPTPACFRQKIRSG